MQKAEIEKIVADTLANLPEKFAAKIDNVAIVVQDRPTSAQERKHGRNLLGLYEGVPLSNRTQGYSAVMPDKITIFQKNLESGGLSEEEITEQVRHTVLHELAHHFGIDDEQLLKNGNY
ncbi:MAG: metallopeptidase family protein [Elusimicrobia bacterium]|nr:metallopeptidase family protein [Elusimicrobiota bacterium]